MWWPAWQWSCSTVECETRAQASNSYLLRLEAAHYGSTVSECVSIFRPELCRALDTKVRTQSAFKNRHQLSGTCTLKASAKVTGRSGHWHQISVSFYTTSKQRAVLTSHLQIQHSLGIPRWRANTTGCCFSSTKSQKTCCNFGLILRARMSLHAFKWECSAALGKLKAAIIDIFITKISKYQMKMWKQCKRSRSWW